MDNFNTSVRLTERYHRTNGMGHDDRLDLRPMMANERIRCVGSRCTPPKKQGRKLRKLDVRNIERYAHFGAYTITYRISQDYTPIDLATHFDDPQQ